MQHASCIMLICLNGLFIYHKLKVISVLKQRQYFHYLQANYLCIFGKQNLENWKKTCSLYSDEYVFEVWYSAQLFATLDSCLTLYNRSTSLNLVLCRLKWTWHLCLFFVLKGLNEIAHLKHCTWGWHSVNVVFFIAIIVVVWMHRII